VPSNYVFNRTRCDGGAVFGFHGPRRLKQRYGYSMKILIALIASFSVSAYAKGICQDYDVKKEDANHWAESSFNKATAEEGMATLQHALSNNGEVNMCGLHNALQIVEGYILKLQAQQALGSKDMSEVALRMNVEGFCEFIKRSKPCE
jgi:hypothetical protein